MSQDTAKTLFSPEQYYEAFNMTLVTDEGLSTGVPENIKGTLQLLNNKSIPDCSNVSELYIDTTISNFNSIILANPIPTIDLTVALPSGPYTLSIPYTAQPSLEAVYKLISDSINANWATLGLQSTYNAQHLVLWSLLDTNYVLINASITLSASNVHIKPNNAYVPASTALQFIGWEKIRDNFYLFSTANDGNGQIWKFNYDKVLYTSSIVLVYNNKLNFQTAHPFANPGSTWTSYENPQIQRVYFTDNFNPPRVINTALAAVMAVIPSDLEWTPNQTLNKPELVSIGPGSGTGLLTGVYQVAYRYNVTNGAQSAFSPLSDVTFVVTPGENLSFIDYMADGPKTNSGKSLTYTIYDVDTNFDYIELVYLYRSTPTAIPDIEMFKTIPISGQSQITFTLYGNEPTVPFSSGEFKAEPVVFDTVKTIAGKNQYLFAGNVTYGDFDVDFDARAYRFQGASQQSIPGKTVVIDSTLGSIIVDPTNSTPHSMWGVPDDYDSIQDYNMQDPVDPTKYLYQQNGTEFGGSGPNVSYRFVYPTDIEGDITDSLFLDNFGMGSGDQYDTAGRNAPYYGVYPHNNTIDLKWDHMQYQNGAPRDYHSPVISSVLKGYFRDEMYRFGVVFFSKKGLPSYTHWIADIRFPRVWMPLSPNPSPPYTLYPYFPTAKYENGTAGTNSKLYPMGIKFDIDVSSIKDQISGFSFVVMPRAEVDKHILGQGQLYPAFNVPGSGNYLLSREPQYLDYGTSYPGMNNCGISGDTVSFNSPDILFKGTFNSLTSDTIEYVSLLQESYTFLLNDKVFNSHGAMKCGRKFMSYDSTLPLGYSTHMGVTRTAFATGYTTHNYKPDLNNLGSDVFNTTKNNGGTTGEPQAIGGPTLIIYGQFSDFSDTGNNYAYKDNVVSYNKNNSISGGSYVNFTNTGKAYIANYKRIVNNQYGGNTYIQRSLNSYISTGHYQPVSTVYNGQDPTAPGMYKYSGYVFGGDTYICMFDNVKDFPVTLTPHYWDDCTTYNDFYFVGDIYPVETTLNINLRSGDSQDGGKGAVFNKQSIQGCTNPQPLNDIESQEVFSLAAYPQSQDTFVLYPAKPVPYLNNRVFDTRVHNSQVKVNGELVDSWISYKPDEYIDLDTTLGPLNNLIIHKDRLVGYQNTGISLLSVLEREIQDSTLNTGAALILGVGGVLKRYDYISKKIGSSHQFSFVQSPDSIFFYDNNTKSIYKQLDTTPESISLLSGMSGYLRTNLIGDISKLDNPFLFTGVTGTYDYMRKEAIFSFYDKVSVPTVSYPRFTLVYSDFIGAFTGFYNHYPTMYMNDGLNYLSAGDHKTNNTIHIHRKGDPGSFYNHTYPSTITLLLNPKGTNQYGYQMDITQTSKVFDNFSFLTDSFDSTGLEISSDTFDTIRVYNDFQDSDTRSLYPLGELMIRKERGWNIANLRNRVLYDINGNFASLSPTDPLFAERFRDKYLFVNLSYSNLTKNRLVLNNFKSDFRISPR